MTGEGRRESSGRNWTPRLAFVAVALVAVAGAYAVLSGMLGGPSPAGTRVDAALEAVTIPVEGITCGACAASIKTTLKSVAGVRAVEVNLERRTVLVRYAPGQVPPERLVAEINELGYKAILPAGPGLLGIDKLLPERLNLDGLQSVWQGQLDRHEGEGAPR